MAFDVFLSYSTADRNVANAVCAEIEKHGVRVWMAPRNIELGATWASSIDRAIQSTPVFLLLHSRNANASDNIANEVGIAASKRRIIIQLRLEQVNLEGGLNYHLQNKQWFDLFPPPLASRVAELAAHVRLCALATPLTREKAVSPVAAEPKRSFSTTPAKPKRVGLLDADPSPPNSRAPSVRGNLFPWRLMGTTAAAAIIAGIALVWALNDSGETRQASDGVIPSVVAMDDLPSVRRTVQTPKCISNNSFVCVDSATTMPGSPLLAAGPSGWAQIRDDASLTFRDAPQAAPIRIAYIKSLTAGAAMRINQILLSMAPIQCSHPASQSVLYQCFYGQGGEDLSWRIISEGWGVPTAEAPGKWQEAARIKK